MEPITVGVIALIAMLGGAGGGSAVVAHQKGKVIAALQTRIAQLQRKILLWQGRAAELAMRLSESQKTVAQLLTQLDESQARRRHLMDLLHAADVEISRLKQFRYAMWYFITFRMGVLALRRAKADSDLAEVRRQTEYADQSHRQLHTAAEQMAEQSARISAQLNEVHLELQKAESEVSMGQSAIEQSLAGDAQHDFKNGICRTCGCSEAASNHFKYSCKAA